MELPWSYHGDAFVCTGWLPTGVTLPFDYYRCGARIIYFARIAFLAPVRGRRGREVIQTAVLASLLTVSNLITG